MRRSWIVGAVLWTAGSLAVSALALEDGDGQVWNSYTMEAKLAEGWKVKIQEEFRVGEEMSQVYEQFCEIGLTRDVTRWFQLGVDYRHDYKRSGVTEKWKLEERPQINATLIYRVSGFEFQDRSRLERRLFEKLGGDNDSWRYRNKLTVNLPPQIVAGLFKPYAAAEAFVELTGDRELSRYRLYAGLKRPVTKAFGLDLYSMRQSTKSGDDWIDYNVVGVGLKVTK